ncbi:hypothetical protein DIPPA_28830 [Diplonema papillatum]|nr:hypothetical protein DIPPA_28830 [Diplonema papillatum]
MITQLKASPQTSGVLASGRYLSETGGSFELSCRVAVSAAKCASQDVVFVFCAATPAASGEKAADEGEQGSASSSPELDNEPPQEASEPAIADEIPPSATPAWHERPERAGNTAACPVPARGVLQALVTVSRFERDSLSSIRARQDSRTRSCPHPHVTSAVLSSPGTSLSFSLSEQPVFRGRPVRVLIALFPSSSSPAPRSLSALLCAPIAASTSVYGSGPHVVRLPALELGLAYDVHAHAQIDDLVHLAVEEGIGQNAGPSEPSSGLIRPCAVVRFPPLPHPSVDHPFPVTTRFNRPRPVSAGHQTHRDDRDTPARVRTSKRIRSLLDGDEALLGSSWINPGTDEGIPPLPEEPAETPSDRRIVSTAHVLALKRLFASVARQGAINPSSLVHCQSCQTFSKAVHSDSGGPNMLCMPPSNVSVIKVRRELTALRRFYAIYCNALACTNAHRSIVRWPHVSRILPKDMSHWLKMLGAGEDNLCGSSWTVTWPLFLLLGTAGADDALLFSAVSDAFRDARSRVDGETVDDYARLLRGVCDGLRGLLPNGVSDWALRRYAGDGYRAVECNVAEAITSLTFDMEKTGEILHRAAPFTAISLLG